MGKHNSHKVTLHSIQSGTCSGTAYPDVLGGILMKVSKPLQKGLYIGLLLISIIFFIYALGFFTTLYDVTTGNGGGEAAAVFNAQGEAQSFNKMIMNLSFYGVVISGIMLLMDNHKRKNFFISNLVATLIGSLFFISVSVYVIIKVLYFKEFYMQVNFEFIAILRGVLEVKPNPIVFHEGIVIGIAMILISSACSYIAVLKYKETQERFKAREQAKAGLNV